MRPRASRVDALAAAAAHLDGGWVWVADLDVAAATSGVDPSDLAGQLARWISDDTCARLATA